MDVLRQSYIISGNKALDKALEIAGNAVKSDKQQCPDIVTVYREKTELLVSQVRAVVADSVILPNESQFKVYIFADGDYMNASAQNALLKLLEEPPPYVILILCCSKADVFLPTVRSRCIEISAEGSLDTSYELSEEFIREFSGDILSRIAWLEGHNKMSIGECRSFCENTIQLIADMLCQRHDSYGIEAEVLSSLEQELEKCIKYLNVNVNVKQIFSLLEIF